MAVKFLREGLISTCTTLYVYYEGSCLTNNEHTDIFGSRVQQYRYLVLRNITSAFLIIVHCFFSNYYLTLLESTSC